MEEQTDTVPSATSTARSEPAWKTKFYVDAEDWVHMFLAETGADGLLVNNAWYDKNRF